MPDALNYRVGPHPGCPFMCLLCLTAEKDPRQGSLLSAWMGRASGKDWSRRPFDCQLQEIPIKTDRAITSASEEVSVPGHLVPRGSLQAKQLCHLHTQLSLEQNCHRGKSLASMCEGSLWSCPTLCDPVDSGLPSSSVGGSPGKNTGVYWPILLALPF